MSRDKSTTFRRREALTAAGATLLGLSTAAGGRDSDGYNTQNVISIETEQDLRDIQDLPSLDYVVENDIELTEPFDPITNFSGSLDGQGHVIEGLTFDDPDTSDVGLFASIQEGATVQDIHLRDVDFTVSNDSSSIAPLVGVVGEGSEILRCSAAGNAATTSSSSVIAGLVGDNYGEITESFATVRVQAPVIRSPPLEGFSDYTAGFVARNYETGSITDCYSIGDVTSNGGDGGFVAWHRDGEGSEIATSFSAGRMGSRTRDVGGFVAEPHPDTTESDCYFNKTQLTGNLSPDNDPEGLETEQMQGETAAEALEGFDFDETWETTDGYPILQSIDDDLQLSETERPEERRGALTELEGDGSVSDPYRITTGDELALISSDQVGCYRLDSDIEAEIDEPLHPLLGVLDGRGHTITGLEIDVNLDYVGLFRDVGVTGELKGFRVVDADVSGGDIVGGIAGYNNGVVRRCSFEGEVASWNRVAGLISRNAGVIEECWADIDVNGSGRAAGFVRINWREIRNCYATGEAFSDGFTRTSGFARRNENEIERCFAAVLVDVEEGSNLDGFLGNPVDSDEQECYWDIEVAETSESGGDAEGLFTEDMQGESPEETMSGFDYDEVWSLVEDDYPELRWEQPVTPAFFVEPQNPDPGEEVTFDAAPTTGTVESFAWELGDGTEATGETVAHTYDEEDSYEVTLTVETLLGGLRETTQTVIVGDLPPLPCGENPPQPADGFDDGLHRDIRGTGEFTIFDVQCLFNNLDHPAVEGNPELFNFSDTDSEEVDIFDVQALFEDLTGQD